MEKRLARMQSIRGRGRLRQRNRRATAKEAGVHGTRARRPARRGPEADSPAEAASGVSLKGRLDIALLNSTIRNQNGTRKGQRKPAGKVRRPGFYRPFFERLEERCPPAISVVTSYPGLTFAQEAGVGQGLPADTSVAVGIDRIVETANQSIQVYFKINGNPINANPLALDTFFYNNPNLVQHPQLNLPRPPGPSRLSDPVVVWDNIHQRFIVGDQDVNTTFTNADQTQNHISRFNIAVSRDTTPDSLNAWNPNTNTGEWFFYQVTTTENNSTQNLIGNAVYDADFPGNFGFNADAFVFTLNMVPKNTRITPASNGLNLPQATINVQSTAGFPNAGNLLIFQRLPLPNGSLSLVNYTGLGANGTSFTGVTSGGGTLSTDDTLVFTANPTTANAGQNLALLPGNTLNVASTAGFLNAGSLWVQTNAGVNLITYDGLGAGGTSFLNCSANGVGTTFANSYVVQHTPYHVQVNHLRMTALIAGTGAGTNITGTNNAFQHDVFSGTGPNQVPNLDTLRPTVMHDSVAGQGNPMWLVAATNNPSNSTSINVVRMNNVLGAATFTNTAVAVNAYWNADPPLQPNGTSLSVGHIDSRMEKAALWNNLLVASHTIQPAETANQDNVRWYLLDVSSGTPVRLQQGDVVNPATHAGEAGYYNYYSSIDINNAGVIGLTYMQSANIAGQVPSIWVTGRTPSDAPGSMQLPTLGVWAGGVHHDRVTSATGVTTNPYRVGDLSAINVDPVDQTFWAGNEFAVTPFNDQAPFAPNSIFSNWGTRIAHFSTNFISPQVATPAVGRLPTGVVTGDFNGDTKQDMAVANYYSNSVSILLGNGNGTFATQPTIPAGNRPFVIASGDFDGINGPDLVVGDFTGETFFVLLGNGNGQFHNSSQTPIVNQYPGGARHKIWGLTVGQINPKPPGDNNPAHDNFLDIVATNGENTYTVLLGNGNGGNPNDWTFKPITTSSIFNALTPIQGVAVANLGDPYPDLVVAARAANKVGVIKGNGDGTFQSALNSYNNVVGDTPKFLAVGDFNGDGKVDTVTSNNGYNAPHVYSISVLLGNGIGTFGAATSYSSGLAPLDITVSDLNQDGFLDVINAAQGTTSTNGSVAVFLGNSNGTFQAAQTFASGAFPFGIATGDFNGDGFPDIAATNFVFNPSDTVTVATSSATSVPRITRVQDGLANTITTAAQGSTVTIIGFNFLNVLSVTFNGVAGTSLNVVSANQITVTVPNAPGTGLIRVMAAGGIGTIAFTVT